MNGQVIIFLARKLKPAVEASNFSHKMANIRPVGVINHVIVDISCMCVVLYQSRRLNLLKKIFGQCG